MLDIADLPEEQKAVMLFLLRDSGNLDGVTFDVLRAQFGTALDLRGALAELIQRGLLTESGDPPNLCYRVTLGRKRGARSGRGAGLFDSITDEQ